MEMVLKVQVLMGIHVNHQARMISILTKERQTWTKTLNTAVMEHYFLSRPVGEEGEPVRRYRRRMHNIWKERYGTEITKQRLCDQARIIKEK